MKFFSFKGGIHPNDYKEITKNIKIEDFNTPNNVIIPLNQHIGAPSKPIVKVGDNVKVGQLIAEATGFVSANIHSSVSGIVKNIIDKDKNNNMATSIEIENDQNYDVCESVNDLKVADYQKLSKAEIVEKIKDFGIVGMGGAQFPTHVKLSPPKDKPIDSVLINGAECEPFLNADYRVMMEYSKELLEGIKILLKSVDAKDAIIGIEDNKKEAIELLEKEVQNIPNIKVCRLKTKYPQGAEKQLIKACIDREVPSGGLPMDVGVVVSNVGTAYQIYESFTTGMPLYRRVATISGDAIKEPKNLRVRIGTVIKDIESHCGGLKEPVKKIISGGPMMGFAKSNNLFSITKGSSGILYFSSKMLSKETYDQCIRCSRCVDICPMFLQPLYISDFSLNGNYDQSEEFNAMDCIECSSCSYICPSKRPLVESIRIAKTEIINKKNKKK